MISPLKYQEQQLFLLDQSRLPHEVIYDWYQTADEVAEAIRSLKVRGAPLIGIAAAYAVVLAFRQYSPGDGLMEPYFWRTKNRLAATRPTAVNLFWALDRMEKVFSKYQEKEYEQLLGALELEADTIYQENMDNDRKLSEHGQALLSKPSNVLTICNAGNLATGGFGTALGIVRAAFQNQKINMVWACETRPVLQGARLTVWELMQENIPVTLITDSMAGYIMASKEIHAVITGADRIAANGDAANKIGTYTLAVLAAYHHIPFYVAAPRSTFDDKLCSGGEIPIEERHGDEVRCFQDKYLTVPEVPVFNPAFDITPHHLIAGIITEEGVFKPPYDFCRQTERL